MPSKRRQFSAEFKSKVAIAAIKGQMTTADLAAKYNVHPTQISLWKKQLMDSLPEVFGRKRARDKQDRQELEDELYNQIGRHKVELDWLKKIWLGRRSVSAWLLIYAILICHSHASVICLGFLAAVITISPMGKHHSMKCSCIASMKFTWRIPLWAWGK